MVIEPCVERSAAVRFLSVTRQSDQDESLAILSRWKLALPAGGSIHAARKTHRPARRERIRIQDDGKARTVGLEWFR